MNCNVSVKVYIISQHYFYKYEKAEKAHQEAADETKFCREILAVTEPPSEDEKNSHKQENLNIALQKATEA